MKSEMNYLSIRDLKFGYEDELTPIINGFSCQVPLGSRVAILGLNGSGKTTFLNLLLGILRPISGDIHLKKNTKSNLLRNLNGAVGFLPQLETIPFDFSVEEYVLLGRMPYIQMFSVPSQTDKKIVKEVLDSLKMAVFLEKKLRKISGGELQRVRLARILAQNPEIILMDEPATHLDIKNKKFLYNLINKLSGEGKTILFSSHDPIDIPEISDYCVLMGKGRKPIFNDTRALILGNQLSEYFETPITF